MSNDHVHPMMQPALGAIAPPRPAFMWYAEVPEELRAQYTRPHEDVEELEASWLRESGDYELESHARYLGGYEPYLKELAQFEQEYRERWAREAEEKKQRAAEWHREQLEARKQEHGFQYPAHSQAQLNHALGVVVLEAALDRLTAAVDRVAYAIANDPRRI